MVLDGCMRGGRVDRSGVCCDTLFHPLLSQLLGMHDMTWLQHMYIGGR